MGLKDIQWRQGIRRLLLLYGVMAALAVGWSLTQETFWFTPCRPTFEVPAGYDDVLLERYYADRNKQRESGCLVDDEVARALIPEATRARMNMCPPLTMPPLEAARTVTLTQAELNTCFWEAAWWDVENSPSIRLAGWLLLLPVALWGVFLLCQWLWRGFRPS